MLLGLGGFAAVLGGAYIMKEGLGSRGTRSEYTFTYLGKEAIVQHQDVRLAPDKYWILLNGLDKVERGFLLSDDKKHVTVSSGDFSVEDLLDR